ncbi:MAG: hypothetical protein F4X19_14300 [Acidobacteria bacterium]|nr:hypothetical protein [Acidobacteriota bacterium]
MGGCVFCYNSPYATLRRFPDESQDGQDPLDKLDDRSKNPFGSYHQLIRQEEFRFSARGRGSR